MRAVIEDTVFVCCCKTFVCSLSLFRSSLVFVFFFCVCCPYSCAKQIHVEQLAA